MKKLRRIVAGLTVFLIVALIAGTLICAVTGSKYFLGMLFLSFAVPVVLWVFMWFTHLIHGDSQVISKEEMEAVDKAKQAPGEDVPE
ncbi:MAG: hypothetical protein NC300_07355 [Bacteroidales bacterium]|nr:hypothetical protein [Clostridium sp.]MCM1203944.1 hypothetical protein [Bacteroidales bacterium]